MNIERKSETSPKRFIQTANAARWLVLMLIGGLASGCSRPNAIPTVPHPPSVSIVRSGRLQNGVEWRATATIGGNAVSTRNLSATLDAQNVEIPAGAFDGIPAWDESLVIQFAESGADVFLMLADGRGPSGWLAKFLIHDNRIIERELTITDGEPVLVRYSTDDQVTYRTIPPGELDKHRQQNSSQPPKTQPTNL